jgi:hypothetical protein
MNEWMNDNDVTLHVTSSIWIDVSFLQWRCLCILPLYFLLHTALSQNNKYSLNILCMLISSLIIGSFGNFVHLYGTPWNLPKFTRSLTIFMCSINFTLWYLFIYSNLFPYISFRYIPPERKESHSLYILRHLQSDTTNSRWKEYIKTTVTACII